MLRLIAMLIASLSLCAAPTFAKNFDDGAGRFAVAVPDGWQAEAPKNASGELALIMVGAEGKPFIGICIVTVGATPETKSMSQAEIDAALSAELNENFWKNAMKAGAGTGATMDVESAGSRESARRRVHYAVIVAEGKAKDGTVKKTKGKFEVHALPGMMHGIICMTSAENYDVASVDFETIFLSYEPKSGLVAEAPQSGARSVLTLYAGREFEGAARVLAQDTPNIAALGLARLPLSAAVAGFGRWEICDGQNFTGSCRAITAAETAAPGKTLAIGSARRAKNLGARDVTGVVNAVAARALNEALLRAR
jgi:hypothetical protein